MFTKSYAKVFAVLSFVLYASAAGAADFEKLERGHFIIYHSNRTIANKVSWKAEYHYKRILNHLGVKEFSPWEAGNKCPVYIYKTHGDFVKGTGAPEWSGGLAQYSPFQFSTYEDAPNLLIDALPHEMSHMLLYLFMDGAAVPKWLNEGMAQFEEEDKTAAYRRKKAMKRYVRDGSYIKLSELFTTTSLPHLQEDSIDIFYVEAASVVDHLVTDNIRQNFGKFLTFLKNGTAVEEALKESYQWKYKNGISDLEIRWLEFVKKKY